MFKFIGYIKYAGGLKMNEKEIENSAKFVSGIKTILMEWYKMSEEDANDTIELISEYNIVGPIDFFSMVEEHEATKALIMRKL